MHQKEGRILLEVYWYYVALLLENRVILEGPLRLTECCHFQGARKDVHFLTNQRWQYRNTDTKRSWHYDHSLAPCSCGKNSWSKSFLSAQVLWDTPLSIHQRSLLLPFAAILGFCFGCKCPGAVWLYFFLVFVIDNDPAWTPRCPPALCWSCAPVKSCVWCGVIMPQWLFTLHDTQY